VVGLVRVPGSESKLTRRGLVAAGGGALAALLVGRSPARAAALLGADSPPPVARSPYRSRPDLQPPPITVATPASGTAPGYVFLSPFDITAKPGAAPIPPSQSHVGPLIVDSTGEPVWFLPLGEGAAMGLRVQRYRGKPVLTWFEGAVLGGYGGHYVVFDGTYHRVALVEAGGHGDLHEFLLTQERTALITIYQEITADLRSVGGAANGRLVQGIVQEVDIATGRVLFEWRSFDHVGLDESFQTQVTPAGNVDYFHLNSIDLDRDGNLLVSARHTSAVYKVDRRTGAVIWRLGGKKSDWLVDHRAAFSFQHDVRRRPDGTITLFDNRTALPTATVAARGMRIALHERTVRASLVEQWSPSVPRTAWAMGNVQQLEDGGVFIGWGTDGSFSEFGPNGELRYDARFGDGSVGYRAFRMNWRGRPTGAPSIAVVPVDSATMTVYASWNGATDVARWEVRTGTRPDNVGAAGSSLRTGFETAITVPLAHGYATAVALDAQGRRLGAAAPVPV